MENNYIAIYFYWVAEWTDADQFEAQGKSGDGGQLGHLASETAVTEQ
jgi:hypothetical protein